MGGAVPQSAAGHFQRKREVLDHITAVSLNGAVYFAISLHTS